MGGPGHLEGGHLAEDGEARCDARALAHHGARRLRRPGGLQADLEAGEQARQPALVAARRLRQLEQLDHRPPDLAPCVGRRASRPDRRDDGRLLDLQELEPRPEHHQRPARLGRDGLPGRQGRARRGLQAGRPVHHGSPAGPADEARAARRRRRHGRRVQPGAVHRDQRDPQRPGRGLHPRRGAGEGPGWRRRRRRRFRRARDSARGHVALHQPAGVEPPGDRRGVQADRADGGPPARLDAALGDVRAPPSSASPTRS